jgi:hypothetical protein
MICKTCGVYVAAALTTARGRFATVNINALNEHLDVQAATSISYEGEALEQRQDRRERQWTPVVESN